MQKVDKDYRCGFLCYPRFLQGFSHRYLILAAFSISFFLQQSITNGFPGLIWRTLELKFRLSGSQTGWIASCYEIADTFTSVFLVHFLYKIHKPRLIAAGMFLCGLGGCIFILPHYLSDSYVPAIGIRGDPSGPNLCPIEYDNLKMS